MTLYSNRFSRSLDPLAAMLNNSLPFDQRLALEDVTGSLAWASAIAQAGVLDDHELVVITQGLTQIFQEFEEGHFEFREADEDIHTAVERRLGELIGATAGKLHTGRSRNDQVATDFRLWLLSTCQSLQGHLHHLQATLVARAEKDMGIVLPGYTHFQQAQPILLSHWWLSHFWALQRDQDRLDHLRQELAVMPLGCGALAGTALPIDRFQLARDLGFRSPAPNSLDAVADRDFAAEFLFWAAMIGIHLSRLAEALILYSTHEYGFLTLADVYSTGSSLMPQKKNPDPLELTRGKAGSLIGRLTGLLTLLKGLPSAYDKDLQEDKLPVFEAVDTLALLLPVMAGVLSTLTIHPDRMRQAIDSQVLATDMADYLVRKGVPFRSAHGAVAQAVRRAETLGVKLKDLPLEEWQAIHPDFQTDLFLVFDVEQGIARRSAWGGTSPEQVTEQIRLAKSLLPG